MRILVLVMAVTFGLVVFLFGTSLMFAAPATSLHVDFFSRLLGFICAVIGASIVIDAVD